jgi:hypothetical protein
MLRIIPFRLSHFPSVDVHDIHTCLIPSRNPVTAGDTSTAPQQDAPEDQKHYIHGSGTFQLHGSGVDSPLLDLVQALARSWVKRYGS